MKAIFFLHIPGNLDLLKAQLATYPGTLNPSFLAPGFSTFKADDVAYKALKEKPPFMALAMGEDASRNELSTTATVWVENKELIFSHHGEFSYRDKKDQIWQGLCPEFEKLTKLATIELPPLAPSRAWLKIAQAFSLFPKARSGHALEIGSSPGGASYFLRQQGLELVGLDPGEMDPLFKTDQGFTHLKKPVQDVQPRDLAKKFSLIAVDTNLPASMSVAEAIRVASWSGDVLKEVFLTIKLPAPKLISTLESHKRALRKLGLKTLYKQLPSHHREILLYGYRS
ncbi:MAG: hypothetical protein CME71_06985 [Halobacteriovorax sp.]|nr:hypothetical protein [Halobacteriovorax sp.]